MPPQPPASQRRVLLGVVGAMVFAALPFAFKQVRQREEQARARGGCARWPAV
jgi:hypothetical protein